MSEEKTEQKVLENTDAEKAQETQEPQETQETTQNVIEPKVEDLILGKFKSVDDLKTAYQNLQKQQGEQSEELGQLRKLKQALQLIADKKSEEDSKKNAELEYVQNYLSKYDNDNYFKNDAFKSLYKAAFEALGTNLDTDGFVDMLEKYVASRILISEQLKNAQNENKSVTDSLDFSKGVSKTPEKKLRFQDIPPSELRKYIAKYV